METLRRFRVLVARSTVGLTLLLALGAMPFSRVVAQGIALGGIGGALVFWILALRMEKLPSGPGQKVKSGAFQLTFLRMGVYALVLYKAYTLDPVAGLISAAGALFIVRLVVIFFAFTGLDLKRDNE